jgi:transposase
MAHQSGTDRHQIFFFSLEDQIAADQPVRAIDVFVDSLDLDALGFRKTKAKATGSPPFHPADLLKLYIYGYLNKVRSSRGLARECIRNVELWWLLRGLRPKYRTIAAFRAEHPQALQAVFRQFVALLDSLELIGKEILALDGSKFRAQNSKKNNYNQKKIDRHKAYYDELIKGYFQALEEADEWPEKKELHELADHAEARRAKYERLEEQLNQEQVDQISTVDPDSRSMIIRRQIVEVSYNVQSVVDAKHNLVVSCEATQQNDTHALGKMVAQTKEQLGLEQEAGFELLADKGYHTGKELARCEQENIQTYVAIPKHSQSNKAVPAEGYRSSDFAYYLEQDAYVCPQGYWLTTTGTLTKKGKHDYRIKTYKAGAKRCLSCPAYGRCTIAKNGRVIERSEFQEAIDRNAERLKDNRELYRRRQAIVEHPFGTIKRGWGFDHTLLRGLKKVNGEMALIFLAYNLRRSLSIIGVKALIKAISKVIFGFFCLRRHVVQHIRIFNQGRSWAITELQ